MNDKIFDRVPLMVIDTATNTYTRYVGVKRTGQWRGNKPLPAVEVELLRKDPRTYFGANDPRSAA
jgi:hypothetical protein